MKHIKSEYISSGIDFGTALAIVLSYTLHHSIFWAIVNGFFSWFYVIYYYFTYGGGIH